MVKDSGIGLKENNNGRVEVYQVLDGERDYQDKMSKDPNTLRCMVQQDLNLKPYNEIPSSY